MKHIEPMDLDFRSYIVTYTDTDGSTKTTTLECINKKECKATFTLLYKGCTIISIEVEK